MESGLLNAFHDDQYEISNNNCMKYEEDNNFWSDEHHTLGLQLSETLHGILPISDIDDQHIYFSDEIETQNSVELQPNELEHNFFGISNEEDILYNSLNNIMSSSLPSNELRPVAHSTNCNIYNQTIIDCSDDNEEDNDNCSIVSDINSNNNENEDYDEHNFNENEFETCSRSTFRSRTDSSSIGDYESHSSDEEEHDECLNFTNQNNETTYNNHNNHKNYIDNKQNCTNSVSYIKNLLNNTESKEILNSIEPESNDFIDTTNFDLAKFITEEDDYECHDTTTVIRPNQIDKVNNLSVIEQNEIADDDNSDIEIDIETVNDEECNKSSGDIRNSNDAAMKLYQSELHNLKHKNIQIEDDIDKDPSWCPDSLKLNSNSKKNIIKTKHKVTKIKNILPKKQNTILNNKNYQNKSTKFGIGRGGKNITMSCNKVASSSRDEEEESPKKTVKSNSTLLKNSSPKNIQHSEVDNETTKEILTQSNTELCNDNSVNSVQPSIPIKRKLNLEEYKRRRENPTFCNIKINPDYQMFKNSPNANQTNSAIKNNLCNEKQSLENTIKILASDEKCTSEQKKNNQFVNKIILDPITEAKNKVLRMQELKKQAAQRRLIDFTVSAKVGPVTKILPLEEIVNGKENPTKLIQHKPNNNEYEEIIIVSVSCNTDIKIPPKINNKISKSTALLYNISNTIQRVESIEKMKLSNNSLISSIQNVVLRKSVVANKNSLLKISQVERKALYHEKLQGKQEQHQEQQHGEDKIIMHLPKNRIRKSTHSIATQTNILPEFPPLELILNKNIITTADTIKRRKYRSRNTNYSSDEEEEDDNVLHYKKKYKSRSKSPSQYIRSLTTDHPQSTSNSKRNSYKTSTNTTSSSESERDRRRSRDRNRRVYSTSPSCSERSYSSSSSTSNISSVRHCKRSRSNLAYKRSTNKRLERPNSPAVEERRIVYVGRIETETTKDDIKRKFLVYGPIKQITLHYKDTGMKYGFVTFERAEDAFKAIDNGLRDPKINMYDISFGGRRAFCRATYSDLDGAATNSFQTYTYPSISNKNMPVNNVKDDSFEALLQQMKDRICSTKSTSVTNSKPTVNTTNSRLKA